MSIEPDDQLKLHQIADHFQGILDHQFAMHLRVARRTTALIRIGLFSLGVIAVAMLLLLVTLNYQIKPMIEAVDTMHRHFSHISTDMDVMKEAILEMDANVAQMPVMAGEMGQMQGSVRDMTLTMGDLAARMRNLDTNMANITQSVGRMTATFAVMNQTVGTMGQDVNRMSGPMRAFNWMNPLP